MAQESTPDETVSSETSEVPYDRGWAWMTVLGCCLMNLLVVGGFKSFGILFVEFLETFESSSSATALVMTITGVVNMTIAPVGTGLGRRYSYRLVVMCGGLLTGLGCVVASFASSLPQVIFSYGILTGAGYGLCYASSLVVVNQYFKTRLALANGIAVAGSSIGEFTLPSLIRYLIDVYTFRGALLILGGLMFNLAVCGALYRPLSYYLKNSARDEHLKNQIKETSLLLKENTNLTSSEPPFSPDDKTSLSDENSLQYKINSMGSLEVISSLSLSQKQSNIATERSHHKRRCAKLLQVFLVCDFSVCTSPVFQILIFAAFFSHFGYLHTYIFMPVFAKELGISKQTVSFLLSMGGVAGLVGRVTCGFFANLRLIRTYFLLMIFIILMGINHIICVVVRTYGSFVVYCVLLGLLGGCYMATQPTVVTDLLGKDRMPAAFGFMSTAFGISTTTGPVILGLMKDATGSFAFGFYLCAASSFLAASLFLLYPCARRWEECHL